MVKKIECVRLEDWTRPIDRLDALDKNWLKNRV